MNNGYKIKNFIFDWSGVISDDFQLVFRTYLKIFEYYNKTPLTLEEFRTCFRLPYMDFCREYLEVDHEKELSEIFKKFYTEGNFIPKPIMGVEDILQKLKQLNKVLIVLSSHSFVSKETKRFFPDKDYFDNIYEDIPDKEKAIEKVMQEMNFEVEETVYIGDMVHDIKAGKKAKIKTAAILTGYQSIDVLQKENPDYILSTLKEIFRIIPT